MWFLLLILATTVIANEDVRPVVEISSGKIIGKNVDNKYYAFQGVPYAKPPIGKLRFKDPVEAESWTTMKITDKDGNDCQQYYGGSEDCLYLNVFTKRLPKEGEPLMPVMFYIHGGAFIMGSSSTQTYGPEFLVEKDIVLVSINYRLGIFGFLSTKDNEAPGNVGLKDQVAALRWVQKNIAKFNGDPNSVTIFGHSAGGASVLFLMQSPLSEGLFHRGISQSGNTLTAWALQEHPLEIVHQLTSHFNITTNNTAEIVNELQNIDANILLSTSIEIFHMKSATNKVLAFAPTVEHEYSNAFITKPSIELFLENKYQRVPVMAGYVTEESSVFIPSIVKHLINLTEINNDREQLLSTGLYLKDGPNVKQAVIDEIMKHYFPNGTVDDIDEFLEYMSQDLFINGIRNSVEIINRKATVYYYKFMHKSNIFPLIPGVAHGEELVYLFKTDSYDYNKQEKRISEKITTLWTNFAKTGNPTPTVDPQLDNLQWKAFSSNDTNYLEFTDKLELMKNPNPEDFLFWKNHYEKYSRYPNMYKSK